MPQHDVWAPTTRQIGLRTGESRGRQIHRVMCELHEHTHLALADLLNQIDGEIVVVSGDAEALKLRMRPYLESMGYQLNSQSVKVWKLVRFRG